MKKNMIDSIHPLVMAEEFWANSQFSIARYYGRIKISGNEYIIVNKNGKDIFECSYEAKKCLGFSKVKSSHCRRDFTHK